MSQNSLDSKSVLTECCERRSVCRFLLVHSGDSFRASFYALHLQGMEFQLTAEDDAEPILAGSICCVSFPYRTLFCAYLGSVIDVRQPKTGLRRVVATIPQQFMTTNLRQAFRVPVVRQAELRTTIQTPDECRFEVKTRDLAETGLEIEFSSSDHPSIVVGTIVTVELRFRDEIVNATGEVRRLAGHRCGIMFNDPKDDDQRQSVSLHALVLSIQQLWLKNRMVTD